MKSIEIDIDVNRAIENGRRAFEESPNAILRRLLGLDVIPKVATLPSQLRQSRSSGAYSTSLGSAVVEANSLKELLRRVLLLAERRRPGILAEIAAISTPKGRHIVGSSPEALYPRSPHLTRLAERLNDGWWFDTNVGKAQVLAYLKLISQILKLGQIPTLHKRSEKTPMTLADLGL